VKAEQYRVVLNYHLAATRDTEELALRRKYKIRYFRFYDSSIDRIQNYNDNIGPAKHINQILVLKII